MTRICTPTWWSRTGSRARTGGGARLDGATLFRFTVALSELHEGVLQDLLTERLGVTWTARPRTHSAVPRHDIDGVPAALLEEFSTRSRAIAAAKDDLVADFVARHGRQPTNVEALKLRQRATLETRPDKQHRTLAEQMAGWRARAAERLGTDATAWTRQLLTASPTGALPALSREGIDPGMLADLARVVLDTVAAKRATFAETHVLAEAHRQLHGARFTTPGERLAVAGEVTRLALDAALPLSSPSDPVPHRGAARYSTREIFDAETRLLDAGRALSTRPRSLPRSWPTTLSELGEDQAAAVTSIATSGRDLDLLVGPAGTGKTTSLAALKNAWEQVHGPGSVTGLAPSAAAAQVLADELGIATENTAKWLHEHDRNPARTAQLEQIGRDYDACTSTGSVRARRLAGEHAALQDEIDRWQPTAGQLLIIDEATLAGTLALDRIVTASREAGAKVLLVGDWAQLGAIDAGGAFHMLAHDRPDVAQPGHRPTLRPTPGKPTPRCSLRDGHPDAIEQLRGARPDPLRQPRRDGARAVRRLAPRHRRGPDSAMIAADAGTVAELNALAQAHARDSGDAQPGRVPLADGHLAGVGDRIVTRRNDRRLRCAGQRSGRRGVGEERRHLDRHRHRSRRQRHRPRRRETAPPCCRRLPVRARRTRLRHHRPPSPRRHRRHRPRPDQRQPRPGNCSTSPPPAAAPRTTSTSTSTVQSKKLLWTRSRWTRPMPALNPVSYSRPSSLEAPARPLHTRSSPALATLRVSSSPPPGPLLTASPQRRSVVRRLPPQNSGTDGTVCRRATTCIADRV